MGFAELIFLVGGAVGVYVLLRPLQRWIEVLLLRRLSAGRLRSRRRIVDVTPFTTYSPEKEDREHHS
jgi:hypothetical protein